MKKLGILVLITAVAVGFSGLAFAGNLPEPNLGDGATPVGEDGGSMDGFQAVIGADIDSGVASTTANMPEANVGDGTKAN